MNVIEFSVGQSWKNHVEHTVQITKLSKRYVWFVLDDGATGRHSRADFRWFYPRFVA